jgi:hypothetical protein
LRATLLNVGSREEDLAINYALNVRNWRDVRLQPKTAFSRFPPVHRNDLEGQQTVYFVEKVACRDDALLIHFSG